MLLLFGRRAKSYCRLLKRTDCMGLEKFVNGVASALNHCLERILLLMKKRFLFISGLALVKFVYDVFIIICPIVDFSYISKAITLLKFAFFNLLTFPAF